MPAPLKPIIYIAFANDLQDPGRKLSSLGDEQANIEAAIRDVPGASQQEDRLDELLQRWELVATDDLTPRSLTQPFYSNRVAIFHYGGHAGPEALLLETEDGRNVAGSAQTIIPFLRDQTSLKLIFLNACSTKEWALNLTAGAPDAFCIIATSCPVQDPVAMRFAHDFYNCLASDGTIEEAFNKALHGADVNLTGATRDFGVPEHVTNGLPWALYPPGSCLAKSWRLSTALKNPLLGVPALGPEYTIPERPYVSIRGYEREHAPVFFGRNAEIREIYDWATHETETPIMLFYGQSGSGKSSLLRAGVWPHLDGRASIGYFRREEDLTDDLNLGLSYTTHIPDPEQAAMAWLHSDKPIVVLLDQVEEVITHSVAPKGAKGAPPSNAELTRFFDRIVNIFVDPQTGQPRLPGTKARLILSFRKEYLAEIRNPIVARLPSLIRDFWLDRLSEQNIVDIVEGPVVSDALRAKYQIALEGKTDEEAGFGSYLAGRLYDPLSPVATILQLELNRLWDLWYPTDPDKVSALGDPEGIYQQELQACRAQKDPLDRDQSGAALCYSRKIYELVASSDALEQFVDDQMGTIDDPVLNRGLELDLLYEHTSSLVTAQRRKLGELRALYKDRIDAGELDRLLVRNKELYLLADAGEDESGRKAAGTGSRAAQAGQDESATVLSHDTLAPVIRRRFYISDSPGQRARRVLEDCARGWVNHAKGDLLSGADLRTVRKGMRSMRAASEDEVRLIEASKRHRRRKIFLTVATLVAVIGFFYSFALHEFEAMLSVRLANDAVAAIPNNYDRALLLSAAGYWFQDTPETRDAIMAVHEARPDALAVFHSENMAMGTPAFSADGTRLLITAGDWIELWDIASRKRLWAVHDGYANIGLLNSVAFSPDGKEFAVGALEHVELWRTEDHQLLFGALPGEMKEVTALTFSKDGKYLAGGGGCEQIQVWSLAQDRAPVALRTLDKSCPSTSVDQVVFDPVDSSTLAAWSSSGKVWLENSETGAALAPGPSRGAGGGPFDNGGELAFSANGARLAASTGNGRIDLFNVPDHIRMVTIETGVAVRSFSFSPDGSKIAAAAGDGAVAVWDTDSQIPVKYFADGGSTLDQVTAFSPDLKTAAVEAPDGSVLLLDISRSWSPLPAPGPPLEDSVVAMATSPDGQWIATGTVNAYVTLWDAKTLQRVWSFDGRKMDQQRYPSSVSGLAFTPDSKTLLFPRVDVPQAAQIGLHRLDVASKSMLPDLNAPRGKGEITITGVAAGSVWQVAAVADSGGVHLWDASGKLVATHFAAGPGIPEPVAFSPDGKLLAAENDQYNAIALLDMARIHEAPRLLKGANELEAESVAFGPARHGRSSLLAAGGSHGFWLWNLANGQQTTGSSEYTKGVVFSPDASLVLLALQKSQVELWDIAAGKVVGAPLQQAGPDQSNSPGGIAFSPDGRRIFSGEWRGTLRVWDWGPFALGRVSEHMGDWPALACSIAQRNLGREEWSQFAGQYMPYVRVCRELPGPQ